MDPAACGSNFIILDFCFLLQQNRGKFRCIMEINQYVDCNRIILLSSVHRSSRRSHFIIVCLRLRGPRQSKSISVSGLQSSQGKSKENDETEVWWTVEQLLGWMDHSDVWSGGGKEENGMTRRILINYEMSGFCWNILLLFFQCNLRQLFYFARGACASGRNLLDFLFITLVSF